MTKSLALASIASICGTVSDQRANFARSQCSRKFASVSRCAAERLSGSLARSCRNSFVVRCAARTGKHSSMKTRTTSETARRERLGAVSGCMSGRVLSRRLERDLIRRACDAGRRSSFHATAAESERAPMRAGAPRPAMETAPRIWIGGRNVEDVFLGRGRWGDAGSSTGEHRGRRGAAIGPGCMSGVALSQRTKRSTAASTSGGDERWRGFHECFRSRFLKNAIRSGT